MPRSKHSFKHSSKKTKHSSKKEYLKHRLGKYIEERRPNKLLDFLKKYQYTEYEIYIQKQINKKRDGEKRFLHIFCASGDTRMVKVLLQMGADIELLDEKGNSALHSALNYALETLDYNFFQEVILDMLHISCETLATSKNDYGETPRDMSDEFLKMIMKEQDKFLDNEVDEDYSEVRQTNESSWNQRLFDEMAMEERFTLEDYTFEEHKDTFDHKESFDDWSNRLSHEYHNKYHGVPDKPRVLPKASSSNLPNEAPKSTGSSYTKELRKKLDLMEKRKLYEERCNTIFNTRDRTNLLSFEDIPWPLPSLTRGFVLTEEEKAVICSIFLFGYDEKNQIKYLKKQQVQWHPDRFQQRLRDRLKPSDYESIMTSVTELSKWINSEVECLQKKEKNLDLNC